MANGSWLPEASAADEQSRGLWVPSELAVPPGGLSYVVVEEILGDAIGLAVSNWPEVDTSGRLRFPQPAQLAGVERAWLAEQLTEHRQPRSPEIARRELRIGDVFAVADVELGTVSGDSELRITGWRPPIYDLTAEARAEAKIALYGAVAPVLDPEQARDLQELVEEVEG